MYMLFASNIVIPGYIYKIFCKDADIKDFYIGSTKNPRSRKHSHQAHCIKQTPQKVYEFINANGGFENWIFEVFDVIDLRDTKPKTLLYKEREYVDLLKPTLNTNKPKKEKVPIYNKNLTPEERKIKYDLTRKEYYKNNKDKFKCIVCNFSTHIKTHYDSHQMTQKHKHKCVEFS